MDKIWYRNPSKSEVIGRCGGGDEKPEWPRRTDKSRTLKFTPKKQLWTNHIWNKKNTTINVYTMKYFSCFKFYVQSWVFFTFSDTIVRLVDLQRGVERMMILGQTGVALTLTAVVGGGWTGLIQSKIHSQSPSLQEQMIGN